MQFDFKQLPLSYRICQGAVATAIVMLLVFRHVNTPATPVILKTIFFSVFAVIISTAVLFSSYVILRYPYLSLVQLNDGDFFDQYFTEGATWVRTLVKVTGLCLCLMSGCLVWFSGPDSLLGYGIVIYCAIMVPFFIFYIFRYDPIKNPTLTTFARVTIGFGIVVLPVFIPLLLIGSVRCKRMLAEAPQSTDQSNRSAI